MKSIATIVICLGISAQSFAATTFCELSAQKEDGNYSEKIGSGVLGQEPGAQLILQQTNDVVYMAYRDSKTPGQYGLSTVNAKPLATVASIHEGGTTGALFDSARKIAMICFDKK